MHVMTRDEIIAKLQAHKEDLQKMHIKSLALFGSYARDEATEDSDVDLLVEFDKVPSLLNFVSFQQEIKNKLGIPVDITTKRGLHPVIRDKVFEELHYVQL